MSIRSHYSKDSQVRRHPHGGSRRNPVPTPLPSQRAQQPVQPQPVQQPTQQLTPVQVRRRERTTGTEETEFQPCESCKKCPYKRLVEKAMAGDAQPQPVPQMQTAPQPVAYAQPQVTTQPPVAVQPIMQQTTQPQPNPNEKVGLLTRFRRYVAKNQADMKAHGETTLSEDMAKVGGNWLGGITSGAAKMGQEEIDALSRKKANKASYQEDEDLLDFLQGKKKKPQQQQKRR